MPRPNPDLPEAPKAECGCMSGRALGKPRDAGDRGGIEASDGFSAELCKSKLAERGANKPDLLRLVSASPRSCVKQAGGERGKQAWLLVSGVLVQPS